VDPDIEAVLAGAGSSRRNGFIIGAVLIAAALLITDRGEGLGAANYFLLAIAAMFVLGSLPNEGKRLRRILTSAPSEIAWIYVSRLTRTSKGQEVIHFNSLVLRLRNGATFELGVREDRIEATIAALAALAPGAVTGYSERREESFAAYVQQANATSERAGRRSFAEWEARR